MSLERIAVATAVVSAAVSAGSLLLAWYRGSTRQRPGVARSLVALMLVSAIGLIIALTFASGGDDEAASRAARGTLGAGEYRVRLIGVCEGHLREAQRIEDAEGRRPVYGEIVQLEIATTTRLKALRPPRSLDTDHRMIVVLWGRRVSLLGYYYPRQRRVLRDPDFASEFARALKQVNGLSRAIQKRFVALDVTPECNIFV